MECLKRGIRRPVEAADRRVVSIPNSRTVGHVNAELLVVGNEEPAAPTRHFGPLVMPAVVSVTDRLTEPAQPVRRPTRAAEIIDAPP